MGIKRKDGIYTNIDDGKNVTLGNKADNRNAATDTTEITAMSILKQISYLLQNPIAQGVSAGSNIIGKVGIDQTTDGTTNKVNAQNSTHDNLNANANIQVNNTDVASGNPIFATLEDGKNVTLGTKTDNKSTATDTTSVSAISLFKEMSYMLQNPAFVRSGSKAFKILTSFTRPADTNVYAADDSISNVSSAIAVSFHDTGDTVTLNSHGLQNGTVVSFATVVTTTGISTSTNYYVIGATTNTFQVSSTFGGTALTLTNDGSGTMNALTLCYDLAADGAVNGQMYQITNARVISSVKGTSLDLNSNIWMFNTIFSGTLDNAALSIDDTTAQTGGIVIPCINTYRNALNHRCTSDPGAWKGKLAANDTKLFFNLQASNAYTPQSGEVLTVVLEGDLL